MALLLTGSVWAEGEWRTWKSTAGTSIEAKLVSYDGKQAVLEKRDGKKMTVPASALSAEDQTFLGKAGATPAAPEVKGETTIAGISAKPGSVSQKIACEADGKWSYHLYLPKDFHTGRKWPVCFIMDPGGAGTGTVDRYVPAAEALGIILAGSIESKNGFAGSQDAMMAMVKDVYARVPVLPKVAISSGMSGGSRMAYLMAETDSNVNGILACGSGAGVYVGEDAGSFRQAKLRKGTAICSLIGTNDFNRTEAVSSHSGFAKDDPLLWFKGRHDWANEALVREGLALTYGRMLERSKDRSLDALRQKFASDQLAWAKEKKASDPVIAYRWGNFLAKFPGADAATQREAQTLATSLPQAAQIAKGEKAVDDFAKKYLTGPRPDGADSEADPSREKDAEKRAGEVEFQLSAELIREMAKPSDKP